MYHPTPNVTRPASQLTEEEQVKIAKRIGLIQHLPTGTYDGCKKNREYETATNIVCLSIYEQQLDCFKY